MDKIRVLIVDDSAVIRRLLSDLLQADPEIEVVGMAANGEIALPKVQQLHPDIVTLDMEMPVMDGIATLKALRKTHQKSPLSCSARSRSAAQPPQWMHLLSGQATMLPSLPMSAESLLAWIKYGTT
jgi:chemotaxis response regulator CheB